MLMRNERLARLRSRFDEISHTLVIDLDGREAARGDLRTPAGRGRSSASSPASAPASCAGPPRVLHAPGFSFSDVASKVVSIINLASLAAIEKSDRRAGHPLRFRANVYVKAGRPGTSSSCSVGRSRSDRPPAQDRQAHRALRGNRRRSRHRHPRSSIPAALLRSFGHADCGVYGEVVAAEILRSENPCPTEVRDRRARHMRRQSAPLC